MLAPSLACKAEKRLRDFHDFHNPQLQAWWLPQGRPPTKKTGSEKMVER
jgi:hypothetical protein